VRGIDAARLCPECKRLAETVAEFGVGTNPRSDMKQLSDEAGLPVEGCYSRKGA